MRRSALESVQTPSGGCGTRRRSERGPRERTRHRRRFERRRHDVRDDPLRAGGGTCLVRQRIGVRAPAPPLDENHVVRRVVTSGVRARRQDGSRAQQDKSIGDALHTVIAPFAERNRPTQITMAADTTGRRLASRPVSRRKVNARIRSARRPTPTRADARPTLKATTSASPNAARCWTPTVDTRTASAVGEGNIPPARARVTRPFRERGRSETGSAWVWPSTCACVLPWWAREARYRVRYIVPPSPSTRSPVPSVSHGYTCSGAKRRSVVATRPKTSTVAVCMKATTTPT